MGRCLKKFASQLLKDPISAQMKPNEDIHFQWDAPGPYGFTAQFA